MFGATALQCGRGRPRSLLSATAVRAGTPALFEITSKADEAFYKVVFQIFDHTLDDPARRDELLAPIVVQNERIGQYMKRRGSVPKVDPSTGVIVGEGVEDAPLDAPSVVPVDAGVLIEPAPVAE